MEEQQRNIDEVFRQSLGDYREAPPGDAWQHIARRLDEEKGRRAFLRWPWVVLSLLLIIGGGGMVARLNRHARVEAEQRQPNPISKRISQPAAAQQIVTSEASPAPTLVPPAKPGLAAQRHYQPRSATVKEASVMRAGVVQSAPEAIASAARPTPAPVSSPAMRPMPASVSEAAERSAETQLQSEDIPAIAQAQRGGTLPVSSGSQHALTQNGVSALPRLSVGKRVEGTPAPVAVQDHPATELPAEPIAALEPGTSALRLDNDAQVKTPRELALLPVPLSAATLPVTDEGRDAAPLAGIEAKAAPVLIASESRIIYPLTIAAEQSHAKSMVPDRAIPTPVQPDVPVKVKVRQSLPLSLTALAAFESALSAPVQTRYSAAMKLLWHINNQIAIGLQPAFRFGNLSNISLSRDIGYQRSSIRVDSTHSAEASPSVFNSLDTIYSYVIRETFDSIVVKGITAGGPFWELELPLLMQVKIGKGAYIYGGPSLNFGGRLSINSGAATETFTVNRKDSIAQSIPIPGAGFDSYFGRSSLQPYSNVKAAESVSDEAQAVRLGYLIGVGYAWSRLVAEASIHQQLSGYKTAAAPVQNVYANPSLRVSLGYRLFAPKQKTPGPIE